MIPNGCTSCIAFLLSMVLILPSAASFPRSVIVDEFGYPIPQQDLYYRETGNDPVRSQTSSLEYPYAMERSWLNDRDLSSRPIKRDYPVLERRGSHTLDKLIRRLLVLQGKRVPEGRTATLRFGSGRK